MNPDQNNNQNLQDHDDAAAGNLQPQPSQPSVEKPFTPPEPVVIKPSVVPATEERELPAGDQTSFAQPSVSSQPTPEVASGVLQPEHPQPTIQPTFAAGGLVSGQSYNTSQSTPRRPKKALLIGGIAAGVVMLLGVGFVFGLYLPSKPENVYRTGLDRSGKAMDKLIVEATKKEKLEEFKNADISASAELNFAGEKYTGSLTSKYDQKKGIHTVSFASDTPDSKQQNISAKLLTEVSDSGLPSLYFQLSGTSLLEGFFPAAKEYDGKWISISKEYLESLGLDMKDISTSGNENEFKTEDAIELVNVASKVTREYVLTSDKEKAVLQNKRYIGKEKLEGIDAQHYEVGVDKGHAKDFCKALITEIVATKAYKKIPGVNSDTADKERDDAIKGCQEGVDRDIKDDDVFEMWIDTKYKLIHKIRIPDEDDKNSYLDIGQMYKGGDDISFFIALHEDKEKVDAKITVDSNVKANTSKGILIVSGGSEEQAYSVKASFEAKPLKGEVTFEKPKDIVSIEEVLAKLGYDPAAYALPAGGGVSSKAADSERQTDINAIHGQLEAYYAQYGFYPGLTEMNTPSWRQGNLLGLDDQAIKAPGGQSALGATATTGQYGYAPIPVNCSSKGRQCASYTLTALLDDGSSFVKRSLTE